MELTSYLSGGSAYHYESDELSESSLSCLDQRNSLTHSGKLRAFGDHSYAKIKIRLSDWIKEGTDPDNEITQIDVEGHETVNSLVQSTLVAIGGNDSFRIKLSLNRDSIKFLRRSLKLVEDRLKSTKSRTKRKWQSKVYSYLESIKRYDKTGHQSSTNESESENESQMHKKTKRDTNFENEHNKGKPVEKINRTFEKRFELPVKNRKDFWFYPRNLIENGRIQEQNFPANTRSFFTDHLDKRLQFLTKLNPDPYVFIHVQHKEPLDESDFEHLLVPKMPKEIVKRVLKGMSQGKLYNIDHNRLSQMFSGLIHEEPNGKAKCPLCDRVYCNRWAISDHLESVHTNFVCFCGQCGHLFLRSGAARIHKCPSKKKNRNSKANN